MTVPDEGSRQRSRVHELARMRRTQLIIYQNLSAPSTRGTSLWHGGTATSSLLPSGNVKMASCPAPAQRH